jgi:prolyl-tRNA synthetase
MSGLEEGVAAMEVNAKQEARKAKKEAKAKAMQAQKPEKGQEAGGGMTATKDNDFSEWYSQLVTKAELIDYYNVSGCYILRPAAYFIWDQIKDFFDSSIKRLGVRNAYFPLFVSKSVLEAEADHIEGFAPEVAWVTKSGSSDLAEPLAIRPTSETIMYPTFARWIHSHRDLPVRINQWSNVVRWEFKHPVPFIRSREFLWQEGHCAWPTLALAHDEVMTILDLYRQVYEDVLAVPVVPGRKSEKEKFAGGDYTMTVEGFVPCNGRAIQAATAHNLGQNFAKIFDIKFEDESKEQSLVWQTSWGLTTRSIGAMIMVHGDDKGMVAPPRVAETQVVIVPIPKGKDEEARAALTSKGLEFSNALNSQGIRTYLDDRANYTPGYKYNYWELRGACLRMELGPRDLEKQNVVLVRRDTREKMIVPWEGLAERVQQELDRMQREMFERAKAERDSRIKPASNWAEFMDALNAKNMMLCPWCEKVECEEEIKRRSAKDSLDSAAEDPAALTGAAKALCIPVTQEALPEGSVCFQCGEAASVRCLFGRSY